MATIILDMTPITGSSTLKGFEDKLPVEAIRESLVRPKQVSTASSVRSVNRTLHSDICLVRYRDSASPKLATAASAATHFSEAFISLFRTLEGVGPKEYMQYSLKDVFISRYEAGTVDAEGAEWEPHLNPGDPMPPPSWGISSVVGMTGIPTGFRQAPRPVCPAARGMPAESNKELERIWLSAGQVEWKYTIYTELGAASGSVSGEWNIVGNHKV